MDKPKPPIITDHRRKRLTLWALTVLGWLAAVLFGESDAHYRHLPNASTSLPRLPRASPSRSWSRARCNSPSRAPRRLHYWKHGRSLRRAHFRRSLLGARLRRLAQSQRPGERIAQPHRAPAQLDTHARYLAQRLTKLRRLWRKCPKSRRPPRC